MLPFKMTRKKPLSPFKGNNRTLIKGNSNSKSANSVLEWI